MARLPKEPADFEYGRRLYVGRMNFDEQQRLTADKHVDNIGHVPHSETKKPYASDLDYPEMEHFRFDLGEWPSFPTPEFPPPVIEDLPDIPGEGDYRIEYNQRKCKFMTDFVPDTIGTEEITRAKLEASENPLVGLDVEGPADILTDLAALFRCSDERLNDDYRNGCDIEIQAWDDVSGYQIPGTNLIPVKVIGTTKNGRQCEAVFNIQACPAEFEWHPTFNIKNVAISSSYNIYVKGGVPPFSWEATSDGGVVTLDEAITKTRVNVLNTDDEVCGNVEVIVTDACGTEVLANLFGPGGWTLQTLPPSGCPLDFYGFEMVDIPMPAITAIWAYSTRTEYAIQAIDMLQFTLITTTTFVCSYATPAQQEGCPYYNENCEDTVLPDRFLDCVDYQVVNWHRPPYTCLAEHLRYGETDCYDGSDCLTDEECGTYDEVIMVTCLFFTELKHYRWGCPP